MPDLLPVSARSSVLVLHGGHAVAGSVGNIREHDYLLCVCRCSYVGGEEVVVAIVSSILRKVRVKGEGPHSAQFTRGVNLLVVDRIAFNLCQCSRLATNPTYDHGRLLQRLW